MSKTTKATDFVTLDQWTYIDMQDTIARQEKMVKSLICISQLLVSNVKALLEKDPVRAEVYASKATDLTCSLKDYLLSHTAADE
jgi:hypothetical protein